jgi:hypothetical protein
MMNLKRFGRKKYSYWPGICLEDYRNHEKTSVRIAQMPVEHRTESVTAASI